MEILVATTPEMSIRYFRPPEVLCPYFQGFLFLETHIEPDKTVSDFIMPTWGLVNWRDRPNLELRMREGGLFNAGLSGAVGPFDHAVPFVAGPIRQWTAVMLPAGWARFVRAPARQYANRATSLEDDPAFALFRPVGDRLFNGAGDVQVEYRTIVERLLPVLEHPERQNETRIEEIAAALTDGRIAKVSQLAERVGLAQRTLERVCDAAFGLPPKMLLRRQRFMRSVTQYLANGGSLWTEAIDQLYHDQPQFVREFREFTGMAPREFAKTERPLTTSILIEAARLWEAQGPAAE